MSMINSYRVLGFSSIVVSLSSIASIFVVGVDSDAISNLSILMLCVGLAINLVVFIHVSIYLLHCFNYHNNSDLVEFRFAFCASLVSSVLIAIALIMS